MAVGVVLLLLGVWLVSRTILGGLADTILSLGRG
jgi:hypothetical protein